MRARSIAAAWTLAAAVAGPLPPPTAQSPPEPISWSSLHPRDQVALLRGLEARRLAGRVGPAIWSGLDVAKIPLLLVRPGDVAFLIDHPDPPPEYRPLTGSPAGATVHLLRGEDRRLASSTTAPFRGVVTALVDLDGEPGAAPGGHPPSETVIARLADILLIQTIRSWIEQDDTIQRGWLGALQDQQLGQTLSLIHRNPVHLWTVASLAKEAAMSRAGFAARFKAMIGESPMQYVTRGKMHLALTWLKEEDTPLSELALRLGYQSEAAFSRAFKRIMGVAPGGIRRQDAWGFID